jgi:hypothetical protein
MKTIQVTIVEISQNIRTRSGAADLYKGWSESEETIISLWSDSAKPNPFLKGAEVGSEVRVVEENRQDTDMNGVKTQKTYYTPIPSKT